MIVPVFIIPDHFLLTESAIISSVKYRFPSAAGSVVVPPIPDRSKPGGHQPATGPNVLRRRAPNHLESAQTRSCNARLTTVSTSAPVNGQAEDQDRDRSGVLTRSRVLRCRPQEDDRTVFHRRQQGILLPLVKTVNLIDKNHRPLSLQSVPVLRFFNQFSEFGHPGRNGVDRLKMGLRILGN